MLFRSLSHAPEVGPRGDAVGGSQWLGWTVPAVYRYGIPRFLAEADAGRDWRECAGSHFGACLNWVATEGFGMFFREIDPTWLWETAADYRARHIQALTKALSRGV